MGQQKALVRVHKSRLAWRDPKKQRIELAQVLEEATEFDVALAWFGLRVSPNGAPIPSIPRNLGNDFGGRLQVLPELINRIGAWEGPTHPNNGDWVPGPRWLCAPDCGGRYIRLVQGKFFRDRRADLGQSGVRVKEARINLHPERLGALRRKFRKRDTVEPKIGERFMNIEVFWRDTNDLGHRGPQLREHVLYGLRAFLRRRFWLRTRCTRAAVVQGLYDLFWPSISHHELAVPLMKGCVQCVHTGICRHRLQPKAVGHRMRSRLWHRHPALGPKRPIDRDAAPTPLPLGHLRCSFGHETVLPSIGKSIAALTHITA